MLTAALSDPSCTPEEKQNLNFFVTKIGPWLGDHGPMYARDYWVSTLPRSFHLAPATKHLMTAIGLMEQPALFEPEVLLHRQERIQYHYAKALIAMTQQEIHPLDVALGPMLAWILEARTGNYPASSVHAAAIDRLSRQGGTSDISQWELDTVASQMVRSQQLLPPIDEPPTALAKVHDTLVVRNQACRSVTAEEILHRFEVYYDAFTPSEMAPEDIPVAEAFIQKAMKEILANVYRVDTTMILFGALHFLCLLSMQVLPRPKMPGILVADPVVVGVEYILEQCEDIRLRKLKNAKEQEVLQRTVTLMIKVMKDYAPEEWRHSQRLRLEKAGVYTGA